MDTKVVVFCVGSLVNSIPTQLNPIIIKKEVFGISPLHKPSCSTDYFTFHSRWCSTYCCVHVFKYEIFQARMENQFKPRVCFFKYWNQNWDENDIKILSIDNFLRATISNLLFILIAVSTFLISLLNDANNSFMFHQKYFPNWQ